MKKENIVWSFSGAAARAIALFRLAEVSKERGEKPDVIIGTSSGALAAPILAVAFDDPKLLDEAIEFAETLDTRDMFPVRGNKPFNAKGKPTVGSIFRAMSHNHLGWQDIKPMYKKVFKQEHFELLKKSKIRCYSYGVIGKTWTPVRYCLNDAESIDDMINMIECSSRIVPFVQPMVYKGEGHVDGGYICFNPGWTLFEDHNITTLVSMYSHEPRLGVKPVEKWDKGVLSIAHQCMMGMNHSLGYKDARLEKLEAQVAGTRLLQLFAPDGHTDEIYETDDDQLRSLGVASYRIAHEKWDDFEFKYQINSYL